MLYKQICQSLTKLSKDNSTKVAAIITNQYGSVVSIGYNGLPRGFDDSNLNYQNKDLDIVDNEKVFYKYDLFEHAERNALYNFAKENTKLSEVGNYLIIDSIDTAEDLRAILSSGVKTVFYKKINQDKKFLNLFKHYKQYILFIELNIDNLQSSDNYYFNKANQFHELFSQSINKNFAAFFSKEHSVISIGWDGVPDYIQYSLKKNNNLDLTDKFYHQSAIKNSICNLIANKIGDLNYSIYATLSPCWHCAYALLASGIKFKNIKYDGFSLSTTTNPNWNKEWLGFKTFCEENLDINDDGHKVFSSSSLHSC